MQLSRSIGNAVVSVVDWFLDQLFAVCRLGHIFFGLISACMLSTEFLLMICVLFCAWSIGCPELHLPYVLNAPCLKSHDWRIVSLSCMFDLGTIFSLLDCGSLNWYERIVPVLQYLATWLMGGGILLGVVIGRGGGYLLRVREGCCRYKKFLRKHYVVLGWEPNSVTLLRELSSRRKWVCRLWPFAIAWWSRPRVVIVSKASAVDVNRQLRKSYGIDSTWTRLFCKLPFSRIIYNGNYDDADEFENVNIDSATEVFITGELDEEGHDSHFLMATASLNEFAKKKNIRQLRVRLRIASPILHHQIANRDLSCSHLAITPFSFHVNWARSLWGDDGRALIDNNRKFDLVHHACREGRAETDSAILVVVGMGRMGLAIVERAMEISANLKLHLAVWVVDPHKHEREEQLRTAYKEDVDTCGLYCTFHFIDGRADSETFTSQFMSLVRTNIPVVVVVTLARPDKALECAFNFDRIVRDIKADNVGILLRQNVDVEDDKDCALLPAHSFGVRNMYLFGFQNGAGYGAIRKEKKENEESRD